MELRGAVATSLYQPNGARAAQTQIPNDDDGEILDGAYHGNGGDIHRPDLVGCKDQRVSKWIKRDTASALRF